MRRRAGQYYVLQDAPFGIQLLAGFREELETDLYDELDFLWRAIGTTELNPKARRGRHDGGIGLPARKILRGATRGRKPQVSAGSLASSRSCFCAGIWSGVEWDLHGSTGVTGGVIRAARDKRATVEANLQWLGRFFDGVNGWQGQTMRQSKNVPGCLPGRSIWAHWSFAKPLGCAAAQT